MERVFNVVRDKWSGGWRLECRVTQEARVFTTRIEAVNRGSERCRQARPSRLIVHSLDGRVQEQRLYARV